MTSRYALQKLVPEWETGINAAPLNATITGDWFSTDGYTQATLEIEVTDASDSVTAIILAIDTAEDGATAHHDVVGSTALTGVETLLRHTITWDPSAIGKLISYPLPLNYKHMRLSTTGAATGAAAIDLLTIRVRLGVV